MLFDQPLEKLVQNDLQGMNQIHDGRLVQIFRMILFDMGRLSQYQEEPSPFPEALDPA
uniref:Uncharacterized protein n=1 Tax=viral metagenome TaxID=1070528 RepID=A0A6C0ANK7_9ZZZZ